MTDRHQAQAYPLRLPEDLKRQVAEAAFENGRSLNAEIAARLAASFTAPPNVTALEERVAQLVDLLDHQRTALDVLRLFPMGFGTRVLDVLKQLPPATLSKLAGAMDLAAISSAAVHEDFAGFLKVWIDQQAFGSGPKAAREELSATEIEPRPVTAKKRRVRLQSK